MTTRRNTTLLGAALLTLGTTAEFTSGCAHRSRPNELPVCEVPLHTSHRTDTSSSLEAARWFSFLLRDYDAESRRPAEPLRSCVGWEVQWTEDATRCEDDQPTSTPETPTPHALEDHHLIRGETPDGQSLLWVVTGTYSNGDGVGPIALSGWNERGLAVHALGVLRAPLDDLTLQLVTLGEQELLLVEASRCSSEDRSRCVSEVQLLPREGPRFLSSAIHDGAGECVGPANLRLTREFEAAAEGQRVHVYTLRTQMEVADDTLLLHDQLTGVERGAPGEDSEPIPFRGASGERAIRVRDGKLIATSTSMWERTLQRITAEATEITIQ